MAEVAEKRPSAQSQINREVIGRLRELGGKGMKEDEIVHEGERMVLPLKMTNEQAVAYLQRKIKEDEEVTNFHKTFKYRPWDGAAATQTALKKVFGMVGSEAQQTMFGKVPPSMITIEVGPNQTTEVPWGIITLPILPGAKIHTATAMDEEFGQLYRMVVEAPRKYRFEIEGIFRLIQHELETNSIYRGKAIDGAEMPSFLDLDGVDPRRVTYSAEVLTQLEANVWVLLDRTEDMRTHKLPLKRAVLIEGPYGTGKTLAAFLTAQRATRSAWTFLYARPGKDDLTEVMRTARLYQPAVVFMEDMDVIEGANDTENEDKVSEMLDLFDGINAKGTEIVVVLTTNHPEKITTGMLRPGRLDAVIHIGELDAAGIEKLIRANIAERNLALDIDFKPIVEAMAGFMPAFVKEAGDRAIRYAMARGENPAEVRLSTSDFVEAARGLYPQLELMRKERDAKPDTLEEAFKKTIKDANNGHGLERDVKEILETIR